MKGGVWGGFLLCASQQMKELAEKSHLLVVTLLSPGSHHIMRRQHGGGVGWGGGVGEGKAERSYR